MIKVIFVIFVIFVTYVISVIYVRGRASPALREFCDFRRGPVHAEEPGKAQSGHSNMILDIENFRGGPVKETPCNSCNLCNISNLCNFSNLFIYRVRIIYWPTPFLALPKALRSKGNSNGY